MRIMVSASDRLSMSIVGSAFIEDVPKVDLMFGYLWKEVPTTRFQFAGTCGCAK